MMEHKQKPLCPFKKVVEKDYSRQRCPARPPSWSASMFAPGSGAWHTGAAAASGWNRKSRKSEGRDNHMGIMDVFNPEDRVSVKFSDFYALMRDSTKVEFMENAINCNVPHRYIRETVTGKAEVEPETEESQNGD